LTEPAQQGSYKEVLDMKVKIHSALYWTPRLLSLAFVGFLMLFSLDVITPGASLRDIMVGMLMHNIPALILLVFVLIAWKYEIVGTIVFILTGLIYIGLNIYNGVPMPMALSWSLIFSGPAFLIAYLYYQNWQYKRRNVSR
jgi:hypothetical protein